MRICEHGNLYCDSIICGGDGLPWETVETQMRRIVYETNIGRWPYMTRKWPEKQRIKCVDYLAAKVRRVKRRHPLELECNANVTQDTTRVIYTPWSPSVDKSQIATDVLS